MHQIMFFLLAFFHVALNEKNPKPNLVKPDYVPYCLTRDICWPDCECKTAKNCTIIPMSKPTKEKILTIMNQRRDIQSRGEPVPSGMSMLIHDHQLEEVSKCWAAKCENVYSECFITEKFVETSQSVGQITLEENVKPSSNHWARMIDTWFGEFRSLNHEIVGSLPPGDLGEKVRNSAQMLSDRILQVGCAWSLSAKTVTFVCTFGPRGPHQGEAVYKTGEICTRCLKGYECNFKQPFEKLCKKVKDDFRELTTRHKPTTTEEIDRSGTEDAEEESSSKLSKATWHDPEPEKDFSVLWLFALGLILLILIVLIVFGLFYILRLSTVTS